VSLAALVIAATGIAWGTGAFQLRANNTTPAGGGTASGSTPNSSGNAQTPGNSGNGVGGGPDNKTFTISGDVTGLYPNVAGKVLRLSLKNNSNSAITVTRLTVSVSTAPAGCSTTKLLFGTAKTPGSGSYTPGSPITGNGTASYDVQITMAADAPNDCAAGRFVLSYGGSADKA